MRIWVIKIGESAHTDGPDVRLFRTGTLANFLSAQGHDVVWWTSTFDHQRKRQRFPEDTAVNVAPQLTLRLLHSPGYRRNVSLARMRDHRILADKYARYIRAEPTPDLIVCSFPTIELAAASIRYGLEQGVPVVLDVRDLWPDTFLDVCPRPLRWLGRLCLRPQYAQTRFAFSHATGLLAMSEGVLQWALGHAGRSRGASDAVFPLGYNRAVVAPEAAEAAGVALRERGVDPGKFICWFIGMFGKMYDVATVIRAARQLEGRGNLQFVISGDGERRAEWEALAAGLKNVVFTGWVNANEIAYLMSVAKVGLAAIDAVPGTLPNKLFEYFSAGLPVLSSLEGEAAELIAKENAGIVYPPRDVGRLADGLGRLLDDESLRQTMGANALALYEKRFSAKQVYPRLAEFVTKLAADAALRLATQRSAAPCAND